MHIKVYYTENLLMTISHRFRLGIMKQMMLYEKEALIFIEDKIYNRSQDINL